jgi:hypothetical protein
MKERRQKPGKTFPQLGQAIHRLANLAYPTASSDIRETLSKDQFVDALVAEMQIRIKQSRPGNLNEAIKLAMELEAYHTAEHKSHLGATLAEAGEDTSSLSSMLTKLTEKFDKLQNDVDEMDRRPRHGLRTSTGIQMSGDTAKRKVIIVSTTCTINLVIYVGTVLC